MKFLNQINGADKLVTDASHRVVTDIQISTWDDKIERNFDAGDEIAPLPTIDADLLAGRPPSYYLTGGSGEGGGGLTEEEIKLIKVNSAINADTVNGKTVGINVPTNAIFTDTNIVTSINGKTGAIAKADIVALGIPAQDTVYSHPATHPASMITGLPTSLPANGGNSATTNGFTLGMNVPAGSKLTDTVTSINGKTGAIVKADIVALGIPASDTNTTYTAGANIQINGTTISATNTNTTYTGGTNVTISGTTINATDSKREDSTSEFRLEVRTSDPASPAIGRMWYRSDL